MNDDSAPLPFDLGGHVALITGANHGIGASTATALADCGASVMVSYLRTSDPEDFPEAYRTNRAEFADSELPLATHRAARSTMRNRKATTCRRIAEGS